MKVSLHNFVCKILDRIEKSIFNKGPGPQGLETLINSSVIPGFCNTGSCFQKPNASYRKSLTYNTNYSAFYELLISKIHLFTLVEYKTLQA